MKDTLLADKNEYTVTTQVYNVTQINHIIYNEKVALSYIFKEYLTIDEGESFFTHTYHSHHWRAVVR